MTQDVLYVNPASGVSGAEKSLLTLLRYIDRDRYRPVLVIPSRGRLADEALAMGVDVWLFPMHTMMIESDILSSMREALLAARQIRGIRELYRQIKPEMVHINSYRIGVPFTVAARSMGIPSIWHLRDIPRSRHKRALASTLAHLPRRAIAISRATAAAFGDSTRVVTVYNPVDLDPFASVTPGAFRQEMGFGTTDTVICAVGQLTPWKGFHLIIDALARLPQDTSRYLVIVGDRVDSVIPKDTHDAAYPAYLRQLVQEKGLSSQVRFVGFRSDVPQILTDSDLFVHGATAPEPFGRVIVEAMAARTPVIAPNCGGISEIITDNVDGLLYTMGDIHSLVCRLTEALADMAALRSMADRGHDEVERRFSPMTHAQRVCRIYDEVLGTTQTQGT